MEPVFAIGINNTPEDSPMGKPDVGLENLPLPLVGVTKG